MSSDNEDRKLTLGNYRFRVELGHMIEAGFSEVSGITIETEYEEYREGGLNDYVHKLVKGIKHTPIVLKRGITTTNELWDWYSEIVAGTVVRRDITIILINELGEDFRSWTFEGAYPVKWVGPDFNASASEVAIEQIEFVHNGFKLS